MTALPDGPLDGWEELLVFTDSHVYRWLEMGFNSGPTVVPRSPFVLGRDTHSVLRDDEA